MGEGKRVFLYTGASVFHTGHLSIMAKAAELGSLTVGLIGEGVADGVGDYATTSYIDRVNIIKMISCVDDIVQINDAEGVGYIEAAHPDIVVHGDNWKIGPLAPYRAKVMDVLDSYGGKLVEYPYTKDLYSAQLTRESRQLMSMPERRRPQLRRLLAGNRPVRVMEAHNGITGLIVEKTQVEVDGQQRSFDAIWVSSLTDSTAKGKPDTELVDNTSRLDTIEQIMEVTTKPIILDGDSGGLIEHFQYLVATLERIGVSAVIIEDKVGLKRNSLFGAAGGQSQDSIENFSAKITAGKSVLKTPDFMIIARIESLILEQGMDDALTRARAYVRAGADGIMIHSRSKTPDEVREFCIAFKAEYPDIPIVVVPTSYNDITEVELGEFGADIVIHANHLIRAAFPAMCRAAEIILKNGCSAKADELCMPIKEILTLIPPANL